MSCATGAKSSSARRRSDPTLTQVPERQLEVLGDPAVEQQAGLRVPVVKPADRVADAVEPFFVEGGLGHCRLRASNRG